MKSEDVGLIVGAVSFQDFQPMWSWSTKHHGQTDRQTTCDSKTALCSIVHHAVKTEWWGAGMVTCLGQGAYLHMAQLISLPFTISCSSKSRMVLPFWYSLTRVVPDKRPLNRCCCCCCWGQGSLNTQKACFLHAAGAYDSHKNW